MWVVNIFLVILLAFNPTLAESLIAQGWQLWVYIPIPTETVKNFINHISR